MIMSVGVPISKFIKKLPKFNNTNPGWITQLFMVGVLVTLYNISKFSDRKSEFSKPINI